MAIMFTGVTHTELVTVVDQITAWAGDDRTSAELKLIVKRSGNINDKCMQ